MGYSVEQQLLVEIESLTERLLRAEREREEYRGECHALNERRFALAAAAKGAAESAVTAIERIQALEARADRDESVVRAAYDMVRACIADEGAEAGESRGDRLVRAVLEHQKRSPS